MNVKLSSQIAARVSVSVFGVCLLMKSVVLLAAENLSLGLGSTESIGFSEDIVRVNVQKPGMVEVQASPDKRSLSVTALKSGNTRIEVKLRNGQTESISAFVTGEARASRDNIQEAAKELREIGGLTVTKGGDKVIVSGTLSNRVQGEKFGSVLARFGNLVQDNTEKPYLNSSAVIEVVNGVLVKNGMGNLKLRSYGKILIIQGFAKDPKERELALRIARMIEPTIEDGIESDQFSAGQSLAVDVMFLEASKQNDRTVGLFDKSKGKSTEGFAGAQWNGKSGSIEGGQITWGVAPLASMLQLVQTKGMSKVMSNPRVVVRTGNEANFHSGGIFYLVEQSKKEGDGVNLFPINYGMILKVRPKVDPIGNIDTTILAEVSEVGSSTGATPSITVSKTETSVTLKDGNSILLTGFKNVKERKSVDRVPLLADIPVIGELFKSRKFQDEVKDLMVLLTIKKAELGEDQLKIMEKLSESVKETDGFTKLKDSAQSGVNFSIFD
jgi:pilus assembly protein CpaC